MISSGSIVIIKLINLIYIIILASIHRLRIQNSSWLILNLVSFYWILILNLLKALSVKVLFWIKLNWFFNLLINTRIMLISRSFKIFFIWSQYSHTSCYFFRLISTSDMLIWFSINNTSSDNSRYSLYCSLNRILDINIFYRRLITF